MRYLMALFIALFGVAHALEYQVGEEINVIAYIAQTDDSESIDPEYDVVVEWVWPDEVEPVEIADNYAVFEAIAPTEEAVITVEEYTVTKDGHHVSIVDIDAPDQVEIIHVPRTLRIRVRGELELEILE